METVLKKLDIRGMKCPMCHQKMKDALLALPQVTQVEFKDGYTEVALTADVSQEVLKRTVEGCGFQLES